MNTPDDNIPTTGTMANYTTYDEPSWDDMMEDTKRAVNALDSIYNRLLRIASSAKAGGGNLQDMERLLNQTIPATEEDRRLAFFMSFLAGIKRGSLIEYLFKIRRACLLLLIDGHAVATALNVENSLEIWTDDDGMFHVTRLGDEPEETRPAESRDRGDRPNGTRNEFTEPRRRRGRRNRGRGREKEREAAPRGAATGKPVMNMDQCHQVLAGLAEEKQPAPAQETQSNRPGSAAPASTAEIPGYLAAVMRGTSASREPRELRELEKRAPPKAATPSPVETKKVSAPTETKAPSSTEETAQKTEELTEPQPAQATPPREVEKKGTESPEAPIETGKAPPAPGGDKPQEPPQTVASPAPAADPPKKICWADYSDEETEQPLQPPSNPALAKAMALDWAAEVEEEELKERRSVPSATASRPTVSAAATSRSTPATGGRRDERGGRGGRDDRRDREREREKRDPRGGRGTGRK